MITNNKPKICVPVFGVTQDEIIQAAKKAAESVADIVEWRIDYYEDVKSPEKVSELLKQIYEIFQDKKLLVTFRSKHEGGELELEPDEYVCMYSNILEASYVDLIDVELFMGDNVVKELIDKAHKLGKKVIMSNHDFDKTPESDVIKERLKRMESLGADVAKMAVMPQSKDDVLRLMNTTHEVKALMNVPVVTMSMGKLGVVSRMAGELFGSDMTFGTVTKASAPGQIEADKLNLILDIIHG